MTQKRKHNYPLVEVTWVDSSSYTGWQSRLEKELLECYSAGYLVHRDRHALVMALNASSTSSSNNFGDTMTIPAVCVKRIRRLK